MGAADPDELVGDGDGLGDDAADSVGDALASPLAGALDAASDPEASAPLETVTTAVTVRRVPESDPHAETRSSPAIAAASTR
jgi:hypothetical protein